MKFSVIIPLYNRPEEIDELLKSLTFQNSKNFDVIIVEDGSDIPAKDVVDKYQSKLNIKYYTKPNTGPGLTRNFGIEKSNADYFIFFDSDCIIPAGYINLLERKLDEMYVDCYGGPDAALPNFSPIQKAISYAMTSKISTGGIRGGSERKYKFHPRSFNMGFSREVYQVTKGYSDMRFGEDIDLTLRILEANFKTALIKETYVYHKRRTDFKKFFRQVFNSGCARINIKLRHPNSLKIIHALPSCFLLGCIFLVLLSIITSIFCSIKIGLLCLLPILIFAAIVYMDSSNKNGSKVGRLSVIAVFVQLFGYGAGFLKGVWNGLILKRGDTSGFTKNFYK